MIFIKRALMDDRGLRATIGLSASEFNQLVQRFGPEMEKEGWHRYERDFEQWTRKRKPGGGKNRKFEKFHGKIIFHSLLFQVLSYFRRFRTII